MSQQKQGWVSLDSCITSYLSRSEQSNHKYFRLWHIAFEGMDMLGLDFFYQIRSLKLPINANLTVTLPDDYLNWSKVGVLNGKGEIIPLGYNDKLTTFADLSPSRLSKTQDNTFTDFILFNVPIWYNWWNGEMFMPLYGLPSGAPFVGNFKVDTTNGIILLNETFGYSYIMLEYIASPSQDKDYYIPIQFREAMIAWLAWQDIYYRASNTHMNRGDKVDLKHNFFNERRLANARYRPIDLETAYNWNAESQRLTVKL